jgi:DNA-binding transcriptional ArsR family regulator
MSQAKQVVVVTCDIVKSRLYAAGDRERLQREILKNWTRVQKHYRAGLTSAARFRVTAGDEFQYICGDWTTALYSLTMLRILARTIDMPKPVLLRAALGGGHVTITGGADPYTRDGSAFRLAREGLDAINKERRLTAVRIQREQAKAIVIESFLPIMDRIYERWTTAQAHVLCMIMTGKSTTEITKALGVSHPTLSIHLKRSAWFEYETAMRGIMAMIHGKYKH